ncbi:primosomal protein N' (replication factor Y) - superfamily II helicase [Solirhodobacter olei]|uniref:primosomal protein N' (replication factor Y) - superfamily II helicase n=1 Tax=Solirhodobacter olei TaxID=2493082 RepID=UPI000FD8C4A1|nr:primosomal protein N' (replication factor Y) - superfamily II helicase [Solirhodobacter olei]
MAEAGAGASAGADIHYKCEACGAELRFAPGQTSLVCDHCGHVQSIAGAGNLAPDTIAELDYLSAVAEAVPSAALETVQNVTCPSCGAAFTLPPDVHSSECPFCATPVVAGTGATRRFKPQGVIPFALGEAEARKAMTDWLGRLWFAPSGLQEYARKGRALTGIYVPYWTFDAETVSAYQGERGEVWYETRTVTVNVNGRMEQRTEQVPHVAWYPAAGTVGRRFDDVLVMASKGLPQRYLDALEPWTLAELRDYSPDYLAGFQSEGYTVGLQDGHAEARARMDQVIEADVRRDIGGDQQRIISIDTQASGETFKHILLPVWMAAYKYGGKSYRFVVNGQSGRVQGERPWSAWKIAGAVVVALIAAGALAYYYQFWQQTHGY